MTEHIDEAGVEPESQQPAQEAEPQEGPKSYDEDYVAKLRREAASYRTKVRELEPLAKKAQEIEEANKSEVQRATERAEQLAQELDSTRRNAERFQLAAKYGIGEDHFRYIVGETPEEREEAAVGIAQMLAAAKGIAPRGERPREQLRPGATPTEQLNNEEALYSAYFPGSK